MRSLEDLAFIRDRVLRDIRERPSVRPYLGEDRRLTPRREPEPDAATIEQRRAHRRRQKARYERERYARLKGAHP